MPEVPIVDYKYEVADETPELLFKAAQSYVSTILCLQSICYLSSLTSKQSFQQPFTSHWYMFWNFLRQPSKSQKSQAYSTSSILFKFFKVQMSSGLSDSIFISTSGFNVPLDTHFLSHKSDSCL
ncbi:hypothetical protein FGO68_gene4474 [Halteria grandinella]|uniref:Uncharacterized protein n=1 Tax=Halteria grandinella TaxID=5974 RepID=A0A8J8P1W9_HALGN|nr:hypothetical protein FGO68_gene4474 [Halteria grandinella]